MLKVYAKCLTLFFVLASSLMFVQYSWMFNQDRKHMREHHVESVSFLLDNKSANGSVLFPNQSNNALVSGHIRQNKGFLTIGIPTVKRNDKSYLISTITNLMANTDEAEKREITLLVFLADTEPQGRKYTAKLIHENFQKEIDSGLIVLIQAPDNLYPNFEELPKVGGKSKGKLKWQSKQNFDYAFMMFFAEEMNDYYLQLEDDVETIPGYIQLIKSFIKQQRRQWTCLEFSALGFIAKLYRSTDLNKLGKFLMLFYYENPNDVNYIFFNQIKQQPHRIVRKPTIFLHKGYHSSLSEKKEDRIDPLFDNPLKKNAVIANNTVLNPPAKLYSSFHKYINSPEQCYKEKLIYWTGSPATGRKMVISFDQPQTLYSVKVVTGSDDNPDDILQNGVLQIGSILNQNTCDGIFAARTFYKGEVNIKLEQPSPVKAVCLQIIVLLGQKNWLQFQEISVHAMKS